MNKDILFTCKPKYYIYPGLKNKSEILKLIYLDPIKIIQAIGERFNIPFEVMVKKGRGKKELLKARYMAIHFIYKYTKLKPGEISLLFNKDRTTIIHAKETFDNWMDTMDDLPNLVNEMKNILVEL